MGAVGAAHAQSSVTIYGQFNPSYDFMTVKTYDGVKANVTNMNDNSSRIGFKGVEDLGGGLKALFQAEAYYNIVDKTGFDGSRDAFVGLQGNSWGTVRVGAMDGVYKRISASYDPFGDTISDYNSIIGVENNSRYAKAIDYVSPNFAGFQVMGTYALGASAHISGDVATTDQTRWDLGATYNNGPFNALLAYTMRNNVTDGVVAGSDDTKAWKVGLAYTLPTKTTIRGLYERVKNVEHQNRWLVGVEHPINNIDLMANYISAGDVSGGNSDTGAKAFNLGARYNFSKRTNIMAMYSYLKNDRNGEFYNDAGYASAFNADGDPVSAGDKISGFSVRLQHKF